jgi:hypothetical protein
VTVARLISGQRKIAVSATGGSQREQRKPLSSSPCIQALEGAEMICSYASSTREVGSSEPLISSGSSS